MQILNFYHSGLDFNFSFIFWNKSAALYTTKNKIQNTIKVLEETKKKQKTP